MFPAIAGVEPLAEPNRLFVQDFGPRFAGEGIIDREPPVEDRAREYRVLVSLNPSFGRGDIAQIGVALIGAVIGYGIMRAE
jgi:hypothetical protein